MCRVRIRLPHSEGIPDPVQYASQLKDLPASTVRLIMRDNLASFWSLPRRRSQRFADRSDSDLNQRRRHVRCLICRDGLPLSREQAGMSVRALRMLSASVGAAVAVNDFYPERAEAVAGRSTKQGARRFPCRLTSRTLTSWVPWCRAPRKDLVRSTLLVNNAGVPAGAGHKWVVPFLETSPTDWEPMFRLNLYAVFHCTHVCVGAMVDQGWGRVVNIVSNAGRTGIPCTSAYAAGKAGTIGFTRALATEVGSAGVTVNCLALGRVAAPGDDWQPSFPTSVTPIARPGQPLDVAAAVVWLASEEGGWVTGQTISIDGGHFMT